MIRRALWSTVLVALLGSSVQAATADDFQLLIDPDLTAYIKNTTAADISFDGYQIALHDNAGKLDPVGWYSIIDRVAAGQVSQLIADLGAGALGFGEMAPTSSQIAEANISGVGVLKAGAKFSLGKPFGEGGYYVDFFFKVGGIPDQFPPREPIYVPRVPEPSTLVLATLAGLGLVVMRVRSKR